MTKTQRDIIRTRRRIRHLEKQLIRGRNQKLLTRARRLAQNMEQRESEETVLRERLALLKEELSDITARARETADNIVELETSENPTEYIARKKSEKSKALNEKLSDINRERREIREEIACCEKQLKNSEYDREYALERELELRNRRRRYLMEEYSKELSRLDRLNRSLFRDNMRAYGREDIYV